jgi:multicomponent Na+:H+ antiporter subunit D
VTTPHGAWLVAAALWPVLAMLLVVLGGGRHAARITLLAMPVGLGIALIIGAQVLPDGAPLSYHLGGWAPPLGIGLAADGLSALMLLTTAVVIGAAGLYARADFAPAPARRRRALRWCSGCCCWRSGPA